MAKRQKDIFDFIKTACTVPQIRQVLRECKKDGTEDVRELIKLTSPEDVLIETLRKASTRGFISNERIEKLLKDGEESGNQHIFYFTPKKSDTRKRLNDGDAIASALFGDDWEKSQGFPRLRLLPAKENILEWGDFRTSNVGGKPNDWLGKLYVLERREQQTDDKVEGDGVWRYFEPQLDRVALVVRWNAPDLLEIRVHRSQNTSRTALKAKLKSIWEMFTEAINENEFTPWEVTETVKKAYAELAEKAEEAETSQRETVSKARSTNHTAKTANQDSKFTPPFVPAAMAMFSESGVSATLNSPRGTNFFGSAELKGSFSAFEQRNGACKQSATIWLTEPSNGILKDELRILVGGHESHEIVISSNVKPEVIDYVTNQLRQIQRRTS